ncbi:uncharacterized protein LOC128958267 [Oppia nitens]|uniref:uncharacterized protein LOC128958267 n=1 Tax=Oppia nitens TaxID=1686743 RepID=UPI0023DAA301|nr:uncharacterized protein LOC128958267 [Oppia nitens]
MVLPLAVKLYPDIYLMSEFTKLEKLLIKERQSIDAINRLLQTQATTVQNVRQLLVQFKTLNTVASGNDIAVADDDDGVSSASGPMMLGHPIDVYLLIRRLAVDWKDLNKSIDECIRLLREVLSIQMVVDIQSLDMWQKLDYIGNRQEVISDNDFNDAIEGMRDLVNIYDIDIKSLATGVIKYNTSTNDMKKVITNSRSSVVVSLTDFDCFIIGKQCYDKFEYNSARQWFEAAIDRTDNNRTNSALLADIYEHMAYCEVRTGNLSKAQSLINKSIEIIPNKDNIETIVGKLEDMYNESQIMKPVVSEQQMSGELCRGDRQLDLSIQSKLHCRYLNTTNIPALRLSRIKVELMNTVPEIVVIHQFLTDREIQELKLLAKPRLKRTTVALGGTGLFVTDRHRVAEGGWLADSETPVIQGISQRIAAITGFDITGAEQFNAIKYGVGGYYAHHYDVYVDNNLPLTARVYSKLLNRVATWINYLDDVQAGGATVFPLLNVTVWPEKGAALFWHNLYRSGIVDMMTYHGGCPVLAGSKWIATKWIPELGQEFQTTLIQESSWIQTVEQYIIAEDQRLSRLKSTIDELKRYNQLAVNDGDAYLSHPINLYLLIKRLARDWPQVDSLLEKSTHNGLRYRVNPVHIDELTDAANGLLKLADTYKLDIAALANGTVRFWTESEGREITFGPSDDTHKLTISDCYLIGKQAFSFRNYQIAIQWFNETIKRVDNGTSNLLKSSIAKYLALSYYNLGDYYQARQFIYEANVFADQLSNKFQFNQLFADLINKVIEDESNVYEDEDIDDNQYSDETEDNDTTNSYSEETSESQWSASQTPDDQQQQQQQQQQQHKTQEVLYAISQQLCRGVKRMNRTYESRLKCRYLDTTSRPFLRLTRIKVEEMYDKPEILVFHDFLSPTEVSIMKLLARPRLSRSTVVSETGYIVAETRVAEGGWLTERDHPIVRQITRRISAITRLNAYSADLYNVIKYGVGGHYAHHNDVATSKPGGAYSGHETYADYLNRIATWVNYLSDVDVGGATVFPNLDVRVEPRKGSALFWYNLKSSGFIDWDMLHGGCPVLVGHKWIATKWIYADGQEFHKPCHNYRK